MELLIIIVLAALGISAVCSILEASLLSVNVVRLSQRQRQGDAGAGRMRHLKEHRLDDSISAILTYNTIAHTVGAALSGAQAAVVFGDAWVGVFSGVLTLLILVFTEILPKTAGATYAEKLAGPASRVISLMILPPMKWVLVVTRALTRLVAPKETMDKTTRGDVMAMLRLAEKDGVLAEDESTILSNVLGFDKISVVDIMTPRTVVSLFEQSLSIGEAVTRQNTVAFSRFPVYEGTPDNITGYVLVRELLQSIVNGESGENPVSSLKRPIGRVSDTTTVREALRLFTRDQIHLATVADNFGVFQGLVTMEDLIETALGAEIIDEFDQYTDLQQVAMELRDRRLRRMASAREETSSPRE